MPYFFFFRTHLVPFWHFWPWRQQPPGPLPSTPKQQTASDGQARSPRRGCVQHFSSGPRHLPAQAAWSLGQQTAGKSVPPSLTHRSPSGQQRSPQDSPRHSQAQVFWFRIWSLAQASTQVPLQRIMPGAGQVQAPAARARCDPEAAEHESTQLPSSQVWLGPQHALAPQSVLPVGQGSQRQKSSTQCQSGLIQHRSSSLTGTQVGWTSGRLAIWQGR